MKLKLTRSEKLERLRADFANNPYQFFDGRKVGTANPDNLLPDVGSDLSVYVSERVAKIRSLPKIDDQGSPIHQFERFKNDYIGKPMLLPLISLCILYLRRNVVFEDQVKTIFFRIFDEHTDMVMEHITPRWIISCLRSFAELGRDAGERNLAIAGFTYGSLIRNYESERSFEGLPLDRADYPIPTQRHKIGIRDFGAYRVGQDSAAGILNVLMLQCAQNAGPVGKMIDILLAEVKHGSSIFSRVDKALSTNTQIARQEVIMGFGSEQIPLLIGNDEVDIDD